LDDSPYEHPTPRATLPPFLAARAVYFHSFATRTPEIDRVGARPSGEPLLAKTGFAGRCMDLPGKRPFTLESGRLSPHRPLTLAFWWSLPDGMEPNGGTGFFAFRGKGYVSDFVRGGPWCALRDSAHVFQVWSFPGADNVNGVFDRRFRQDTTLGRGEWHQTVFTASGGTEFTLYLNGRPVFNCRLKSRALREGDGVRRLTLGPAHGGARLLVDELVILDIALRPQEVSEFHGQVRSLKETGLLEALGN
jgi:hypothetical protein